MPEPLFIICPPRSYSSIVCGIIGQHPECYGLPELNIFTGDNLGEISNGVGLLAGPLGRDGMLRTLSQLHEGAQNTDTVARAQEWVAQRLGWPIRKLFDHLQELVGPEILVEKSPSTVFKEEFLARILRVFPKASLLHLLRHPRSMAASVLGLRQGHVALKCVVENVPASDPERVWRLSHERVVVATEWLPVGQCMRLKGEAFLADLEIYLPQICEWLAIRQDAAALEAMKHPERSPYACPGPANAPRGNDPNFLQSPQLDFGRLSRLQEASLVGELSWRPGHFFEPATLKLAKQFGYS